MGGRASREQMSAMVARWRRSGLSAAAFCRRQRIQTQRLRYWLQRVEGASPTQRPAQRRQARPVLAAVRLVDLAATRAEGEVEILLASGERLTVREGTSVQLLRATLEALRERC